MTTQPEQPASRTPPRSRWASLSVAVQITLALGLAGAAFFFLLIWGGGPNDDDDGQRPKRPEEVVKIVGTRTISIQPGTPLDQKLDKDAKVRLEKITTPLMPVTGTALASLRPGDDMTKDSWQFATSELLQTFGDWQKAVNDIQFQKKQLQLIVEMNKKRLERQELVVARKKKLLEAGTETKEILAAEETNLFAFEIQARKETHEQQTAVKLAERAEAILARQLQQNGLDPSMLRSAATEGEIVVAEVPEKMIRYVKVGMHCKVEFFALPDHKPPFSGRVSSVSPVVSKEKRVVNVQFIVKDPRAEIRPGMFATIGIGDERMALVMPADGVLHVGDHDYALVADDDGNWQIFVVEVGELLRNDFDVLPGDMVKSNIEVHSGYSLENPARKLKNEDRVIGSGAILLKPVVVRALQTSVNDADKKQK